MLPTDTAKSHYATSREVAQTLGVCLKTAERRLADGTIPGAFRLGRLWRCPWSSLRSLGDKAVQP